MKKVVITLFLLLLIIVPTIAQQSLDLLTVSGRYATPQPYDSLYSGKAQEVGALINVKIPIVLNDKFIWYSELTYTNATVTNNESFPLENANPVNLNAFILQTGLITKLNESTALQVLLVPRFMTDFKDVNSKNLQFGAIGLVEKRYSKTFMMRFGLLYNQELFGTMLTPLVHLDWQISDRWSIVGLLPIFAKVNYAVSENTAVGFSHFGLTTTYRLGDQAYRNDYIERTSIDLSLYIRQRIVNNFHIEGRLGHTLNRKYGQYAEDEKLDLRLIIFNFGDNRVQKNVNFANGIIANIRLVYNLPL